jgi:formiminoglutamase
MDLTIFFNPVEGLNFSGIAQSDLLHHTVSIHTERMPNWKRADLAIIGVPEERGTYTNNGTGGGIRDIRQQLYRLTKSNKPYRLVDLGNLRCGDSLQETYLRLREVCEILLQHNVVPLVIGGSHDLDYAQYLAYENLGKPISVLNIDAILDMDDSPLATMSERHIHEILVHDPNYLFTFSHLAYQTYLTSPEALMVLEKLYFEAYRLGQIRENLQETEPVIREANMMSFDISAIKLSDAPGNANAHAFGLTAEEACQICWYAGINENMSSAGFYEYNPLYDQRGQTAEVVATMIWYFIEGFYHRKKDTGFHENQYTRYIVPVLDSSVSDPDNPANLIFYKNTATEKWWMEVLHPNQSSPPSIVPCSYQDYLAATEGELPQRWINRYAKLS